MTYKIILSLSILALCGVSGFLGFHVNKYIRCTADLAAYQTPMLGTDD